MDYANKVLQEIQQEQLKEVEKRPFQNMTKTDLRTSTYRAPHSVSDPIGRARMQIMHSGIPGQRWLFGKEQEVDYEEFDEE